ncbi:hypothetical protein Ddc_15643 [Ditylenchus destructor]|nr:hypothetical protein Ddc_15643 [Ditylenchus destructor]
MLKSQSCSNRTPTLLILRTCSGHLSAAQAAFPLPPLSLAQVAKSLLVPAQKPLMLSCLLCYFTVMRSRSHPVPARPPRITTGQTF